MPARSFWLLLPRTFAPTMGLTAATMRCASPSCFVGRLAMGCSFGTGSLGSAVMHSRGVGTGCYGLRSVGTAIAAVAHYS